MSKRFKPLQLLKAEQKAASAPHANIWLSASAGTGKTHVLTARVLRLLLSGVRPETILCLTFTKAGAAEMAERIHKRLADWVRLDDRLLEKELFALGEPRGREQIANARRLFAEVLECPGGLRIQTIHAFCQSLLAGFPAEAGLTPGFRPIEGREEAALARRVLAEMLVAAELGGDLGLIADVEALSRRLGESGAESYLLACARAPDAMAALGPRQGIEPRLRHALDVPLDDVEAVLAERCADAMFDCATLRLIAEANAAWGTAKGRERAEVVAAWLEAAPAERLLRLDALHQVWSRADGALRSFGKGQAPQHPDYDGHCRRAADACGALLAIRARAALAALLAAGLRAGQAYAAAYADAKRSAGLVDFDDLIRAAVQLLETPGMGEWVRYKLDQATDHILVDEAQDTNAQQWTIVRALAEEFFASEGADSEKLRTIFSVGDFKQAIFGFQGTDPIHFADAGRRFALLAAATERPLKVLSLDRSYRSTAPVLTVVDAALREAGIDAPPHRSGVGASGGSVTLWQPLISGEQAGGDAEDGEEGWIDDASRALAGRIARQVRIWLQDKLPLATRGRALKPEDVLILVRRRGALASLIVARLYAEGVSVAGVDRLRLDAPLAVRDLLAAVRFALQPTDDLTLATLLVSPLFGLSQDDLYALAAPRREGEPLIARLRAAPAHAETLAGITAILNAADFSTPYRFLEDILSGPLDGRRKLLRRLGEEARDPIEELLNAALQFEEEATPSLQRFLDWFDRGEVEIKRDPSAPLDAVRVMTVHGAKGLQAPLVILADATADPDRSPPSRIDWPLAPDTLPVPVLRPRKAELAGSLAETVEETKERDRAEHWRLLYVALTRAEEHLVIGGALGPGDRGMVPAQSWYRTVDDAMAGLGAAWEDDVLWGQARRHVEPGAGGVAARAGGRAERPPAEPDWLRRPAAREARPPRPLAPSAIGIDAVADPPPSAMALDAARRGKLLHALFERLPSVPAMRRIEAGDRWLRTAMGVDDAGLRVALLRDACTIIEDPRFAPIFGPEALAEAPLAAVVGEAVVAGTVDRLLVELDRVRIVDFKTGRRVPAGELSIPEHHLRQMAAYAAALAVVFPDRRIEAALLYTAGPTLFELSRDMLARYKPNLGMEEQMHGVAR